MSKVISLRIRDELAAKLQRAARLQGRTASETAVRLLDEALRRNEFAFVEFRDSAAGRQAYLQGTRLATWQIAWLRRYYDSEAATIGSHLGIPANQIAAALAYADAYSEEMALAIDDGSRTLTELQRLIPGLESIEVDATTP